MKPRPGSRSGPRLTPGAVVRRYSTLFGANWRWLLVVTVLFVASLVSGAIAARTSPELHAEMLRQVGNSLQGALEALRQGENARAIGIIFWRNVTIALLILGTGALVFPLIFGLMIVASNAYLIGVIAVLSNQDLSRVLATILPHGIFELPALIIAAAWGLKMGVAWLLPDAAGRRGDTWRETVFEGLWIMPLLIVLLAIAAIVEVLVTGPIARALAT